MTLGMQIKYLIDSVEQEHVILLEVLHFLESIQQLQSAEQDLEGKYF